MNKNTTENEAEDVDVETFIHVEDHIQIRYIDGDEEKLVNQRG